MLTRKFNDLRHEFKKISKPLCFFDLETTGINVSSDRIVEISVLKIYPNGNKESRTWLVNPGIKIPQEAINVHGISNEMVVNEPNFSEIAHEVKSMINNCDLAGTTLINLTFHYLLRSSLGLILILILIIFTPLMFKIFFIRWNKEH